VAKAIAHSPLVKTAWRVAIRTGPAGAAIGYSGAQIDPARIDIRFGELQICRDGGRAAEFDEAAAHAYISQREFSISIELHQARFVRVLDDGPDRAIYTYQRRLLDVAPEQKILDCGRHGDLRSE